MNQMDVSRRVSLTLPADAAYTPVATLALSGLGMIAGLDVDLLGDLRTVTAECMDCLLHQAGMPSTISIQACVTDGSLRVCFASEKRTRIREDDPLGIVVTRGVLETLMPDVCLQCDTDGVHHIECSMPV